MTITSIDIDRQLLQDAKQLLNVSTNREAVQRALEFTITMQRQQLALNRISQREFGEDQVDAPKIEYAD